MSNWYNYILQMPSSRIPFQVLCCQPRKWSEQKFKGTI